MFNINKAVHDSVEANLLEAVHSMPVSWVKGYLKIRFFLQWGLLGFLACLAMVPQPVLAQLTPNAVPFPSDELTGSGAGGGNSTLSGQAVISNAASSFDTLWDTYLSTDSPYFGILLQATNYIVIVGFLLWALAAVWRWVQSNYEKFPWQMAFTPVLVVIMFFNSGQLTLLGLQGYKALVYGANNRMLSQTYNGVRGSDLIKEANIKAGLRDSFQQKNQACQNKPVDEQPQCEDEVKADTEALATNNTSSGFNFNPAEFFAELQDTLLSGPQQLITGFLSLIAGIFHLLMAYGLAVWASSAPLWISINLYPASKSGVQIFVSGLFAAMMSIWLYTVLQIALASQQNTALGLHGLLFPILGGFINPFIALFAGSLGFSAIFAASGVATSGISKLIKRS